MRPGKGCYAKVMAPLYVCYTAAYFVEVNVKSSSVAAAVDFFGVDHNVSIANIYENHLNMGDCVEEEIHAEEIHNETR